MYQDNLDLVLGFPFPENQDFVTQAEGTLQIAEQLQHQIAQAKEVDGNPVVLFTQSCSFHNYPFLRNRC